jgi:aquaglyceroporin related protein
VATLAIDITWFHIPPHFRRMSSHFRKGGSKYDTFSSRSTLPGYLTEIEGINEGSIKWQETHNYYSRYPNRWARIRCVLWPTLFACSHANALVHSEAIREPAAEAIGTMILILFGNGVDCQVVLSSVTGVASSEKGSYLSVSFLYGVGTYFPSILGVHGTDCEHPGAALGIWASAGISGGHINPVVCLFEDSTSALFMCCS